MDVESRLGRAFERSADSVQPDVPDALREVRGKAGRRTAGRRAAVAATVVGVVVAAGLTAKLLAPGADTDPAPVTPPHDDETVGVQVVREVTAADLGLRKLLSVAVGPDGRVYVTDSSQQVAELTPDLEVVRTWGSSGADDGQFRLVQGSIAVGPDGKVYVADTGNFRVQVFSADGRFLRSLGEFGNGPGQFTWPFDLAVGADEFVYVADDKEKTLAKLTADGRQVWRLGGIGESDPRLQGHMHLAMVDAQGRVVVTNDDAGEVMLIGTDGSVVDTLGDEDLLLGGDVCDATVDLGGRFYLTGCTTPSALTVFDAEGSEITSLAEVGLVQAPRWGGDGSGYAVTFDGGLVRLRVETD